MSTRTGGGGRCKRTARDETAGKKRRIFACPERMRGRAAWHVPPNYSNNKTILIIISTSVWEHTALRRARRIGRETERETNNRRARERKRGTKVGREEDEEERTRRPGQNNDNNYHLYASAVITCTRAEHAFNFVSNLNNSNKSLLPALLPLHAL